MTKEYTTIRFPKRLYRLIAEFIERSNLGYRSVPEFVIEAARIRLQEFAKSEIEQDG